MNAVYLVFQHLLSFALPIGILFSANTAVSQNCSGLGSLEINILPPPVPSIQAPASICAGNAATLTVTENFAQYLWSNGATTKVISISTPGDYAVTVTNSGGCMGSSSVQVQANNGPVPVITGTLDTCLGQLLLSVGTGYASVVWSNDSTSNAIMVTDSNTYSVTVTDSIGCTGTSTYTVDIAPQQAVHIVGDTSLCSGTTMTLIAMLSDTATYLWSNGQSGNSISVSAGGTYLVTATSANGCISMDSLVVSDFSSPQPIIAAPPVICDATNTVLSVSDSYVAYVWSTGADSSEIIVNTAGIYSITVTDSHGCTGSSSHVLNGLVSPIPVITASPYACDGVLSLQTGTGYANYLWSNNENVSAISINSSGVYFVTVSDAQGCTGTDSFIADIPPLPSIAISGVNSICEGSNTILSVPAGFNQYLWNNGANNANISIDTGGLYAVTVTDVFGCTTTDTLTVESLQLPNAQITGLEQICTSGMATFSVAGSFSAYSWSTGVNTSSIMVNTAGTYTVTVTAINGCTATDTHTLSTGVNLQPQIQESPYACNGQINLDAGPGFSIYQWSTGQTNQSIAVTNPGTYSVTVGDGNGCTGSSVTATIIPSVPNVDIFGSPTLCSGSTSSLSASPNFVQYLWSSGETSATIAISTENTYTVTVTDDIGCTATNSISIQELPNPTTSINLLPYACDGQLVLNAMGNFSLYEWTGPGGFAATGQQAVVDANGPYDVVVTDANGCTGTASIMANIPVQNTVAINGPLQFCPGGMGNLDASAGFETYEWSTGATQQNITISAAGIYTVTATDALGCSSTASSTAGLFQAPVPVIGGPASVCPGAVATLSLSNTFSSMIWSNGASGASISASAPFSASVTVTDGNGCTGTTSFSVSVWNVPTPVVSTLPYQCDQTLTLDAGIATAYLWEGLNGFSDTAPNPVVDQSGIYFVTVTDANGCSGTASTQVTIPDIPQLSIDGAATICPGQSRDLTASGGFVSYSWSNGQTDAGITVNQAGAYFVTVTDAFGCTASSSINLEPAPALSPTIVQHAYQCDHQLSLSAGNGFNSYFWSIGSTAQNLDVHQSGTYSVTVTDALGCSGTASVQALIPANPFVQIDGLHSLCSGNSALLTASGNALAYTWSNGTSGPVLSISQAGTYSVIATDAYGCTVVENHAVNLAFPVASTLGRTTCRIQEAGTQIHTFTAANGCDSVQTVVTTYEPAKPGYALAMDEEMEAVIGQQIQINVAANFAIDSVAFHSPFSLSCSNCVDPSLVALTSGFILVEVFDQDGCFASGELRISVSNAVRIYVPNVFYPGSGENGFLSVFSGPEVQEVRNFHVFDRWGNALFSSKTLPTNTPGAGWDGTFRNQPMQPGVYVYYFEVLLADGSTVKYKGDVTILK